MYLIFKASAKIHFLVVCVCFVATAVKLCDAAARRGGAPVAPVMEAVIDQACFCFFVKFTKSQDGVDSGIADQ